MRMSAFGETGVKAARRIGALAFAAQIGLAGQAIAQNAPPVMLDGAPLGGSTAAALFQPVLTGAAAFAAPSSSGETTQIELTPPAEGDAFGQALAGLLSGRADRALLEAYAAANYASVWFTVDASGAPTDDARARAMVEALSIADAHALPVARFSQTELSRRLDEGAPTDPAALARLERDLSRAFVALGAALHGGVLRPRDFGADLDISRPVANLGAMIAAARDAADFAELFGRLAPQSADYANLMALWAEYRAIAVAGGWTEGLGGRTLRLGDVGRDVDSLRARLQALGDLETTGVNPVDAATGEAVFDASLDAAVRRFQGRHGLASDGVVGPNTYAALGVGAAERATQIAVNMEQARWRNRDLGARHVLVNIPDFHVDLVENGRIVFRSRVVVGSRRHQTPEFSDEMTHMVVNPRWNVPHSIATEELLPSLVQDPYSLQTRNINVYSPTGGIVDPLTVDWASMSPQNFPFRLRQESGPGNALGDVKFMFPNRHAVYIHDTPAQTLFGRQVRAFSHGCIRIADPEQFAQILLSRQQRDPTARYQLLRSRTGEQYENLAQALPVHIVYRTAWVDADGVRQFRGDIYGRDALVTQALAAIGLAL